MSSNVARLAASKSETKRSKRLLTNTRKSRQQRENIENTQSASLSSVTLANLPIQKQSTQIRKRLLTECQSNAALTPGDRLSNKRQKLLLDDPRPDSATLTSVPPLHRTLSDKSSYLNQTPLHELNPDAKSHSVTPSPWKRPSQLRRTTSDSDADADDEDDPLQKIASPAAKLQALSHSSSMSAKEDPDTVPTIKNSPQPIQEASKTLNQSLSPPSVQPLLSMDDELFGSDTTLTSPEDDSDDDVTGPAHPTTKVKRSRSTKREVPFSIRTRSKRATSSTIAPQCNIESNKSDPFPTSTNDIIALPKIQSSLEQPAPELVVSTAVSIAPMSLMARILEGRRRPPEAELVEEEADSSDDAQPEMAVSAASLLLQAESTPASAPADEVPLSATVVESLLKDIYTAVCPSSSDPSPTPATGLTTAPEDHVFAIPTLPVLRRNRSSSLSRVKTSRSLDLIDRSNTRQFASRQSTRTMPRPRLFQTCRNIMSQSDPDRHRVNIQSISLVLKHSLEQGMRKIQDTALEALSKTELVVKPKVGSVNMQAWSAVIGNGKGLFRESPRRQREMERIAERRSIVEETYRALDFPPPPPGWDKSSLVITNNLAPEKSPAKTRSGKTEKRWPSELDNTLGCDYCRKTYQDHAGLAYHMERCTMAQMQTSIATDTDGDSTASETEDQRMARSPTALLEKKAGIKIMEEVSENNDEEEEDEGGDEEGIIMCVCGSKEDEGAMVQCDKCEVWLHLECLDLSEDDVPDEYFCPTCQGLPTPRTGGKSFRHIPAKASERARSLTKAGRPRRLPESQGDVSAKGSRRVSRPKPVPHWMHVRQDTKIETSSDSEDTYSTGTDEDENRHSQESMGSPQVTLNHDWRSVGQGSGSILGYDSEYMNNLFGGSSSHAIFKKSKAPGLMLNMPSSREVQEELASNLLSTDIILNDQEVILFPGASNHHTIMGTSFGSEALFDQDYGGADSHLSSQSLGSDDTIDSDGLRTPIDLWRDTDQGGRWMSNNFGEVISENAADFDLECSASVSAEYKSTAVAVGLEHYPELLTSNVIDWYCDQDQLRADNFDIDGLIDLEAVSTPEEN